LPPVHRFNRREQLRSTTGTTDKTDVVGDRGSRARRAAQENNGRTAEKQ
jgi:hypothetical protein